MTDDSSEVARLRDEVERLNAENARLSSAGATAAADRPKRHWGRLTLSAALIVIASLLVPCAILGVWLDNVVTDTDTYVETVAPLARSPEIQQAASKRITDELLSEVDLQSEVQQALPNNAAFLASPITSGVQSLIEKIVNRVLASDQFATLWDTANRAAHEQLVAALTNSSGKKGVVDIDLSGVVSEVGKQLDDLGISYFKDAGSKPLNFEVFQSNDVAAAQSAFNFFNTFASILPWVVLALYAAGVFAAPNRRRGLLYAATGLVLATALLLVSVAVGRSLYLDALPTGASIPANETIYDTLTRFLRGSGRTVAVVGVVILIATLVSGPSEAARSVRRGTTNALGSLGKAAEGRGARFGPVGAFISKNLMALRIVVGVLALAALTVQSNPSAGSVLWIAGIAVVLLGVLEFIGRASDAEPERDAGSDSPADLTDAAEGEPVGS